VIVERTRVGQELLENSLSGLARIDIIEQVVQAVAGPTTLVHHADESALPYRATPQADTHLYDLNAWLRCFLVKRCLLSRIQAALPPAPPEVTRAGRRTVRPNHAIATAAHPRHYV